MGDGESDRALTILQDIQHLRAGNGMYWTGYVFEGETEADRAVWPRNRRPAGSLPSRSRPWAARRRRSPSSPATASRRVEPDAAADPAGQALGNEIRIR
ncbi:hypothetical protein STANM309S_00413 [Streptomyces tanashiensis]